LKINRNDNKYIYVLVGKNIKKFRKEKKLTQVELSNLTGYSEGTIANIENSSYQTFSLEFVYIMSKKLNVPLINFFVDEESDNK
jgi:Predicted transcriptional regulators